MEADRTTFIIEDFKRNPDIQRTRHRLLCLLIVELVIILVRFVKQIIYGDPSTGSSSNRGMTEEILGTLIPMIHLMIFLTVVFRYVRIGILVFAWLTIIELITFPIVLIIDIISMNREISSGGTENENKSFIITIYVIAGTIVTIISIFVILLSFKLAKLIKRSRNLPVV